MLGLRKYPIDSMPLDYRPIPELSLEEITGRLRLGDIAMTACIVREGGSVAARHLVTLLETTNVRFASENVTFDTKGTKVFHTDYQGRGGTSDLTIHHNRVGAVQAAVVVWPEFQRVKRSLMLGTLRHKVFTDKDIFDKQEVQTVGNARPTSALMATLQAGDILVFDHTNPHAFRSQTKERISTIYYSVD